MVEVKLSDDGKFIIFLRDGREFYDLLLHGMCVNEIQDRINALGWKRWATADVIRRVKEIAFP